MVVPFLPPQMPGPPIGGPPPGAAVMAAPPMPPPTEMAAGPMPMGPSPLGMAGAGMLDPGLAALSDPMVLAALLELIIQEQEDARKPIRPRWYEKERDSLKKPKAAEIIKKARADKDLYSDLLMRWREDMEWLRMAVVGVFKGHDSETEKTFQDSSLVLDHQLVVTLLATADLNFKVRAPKKIHADDAEKIEHYANCIREANRKRHYRTWGTDLAWDEVKTLLRYGHIVSRRVPMFDTDSDEVPIAADLLDPATCFPTWAGDRGLETMTRIYRESIEKIIGTWDKGDGKLRRKLMSRPLVQAGGMQRERRPDDELEVIEFWDARWHCIVVDGEIIHEWEHDLGEVPFVYVIAPLGDPAQVADPTLSDTVATIRQKIASRGLSHIAYMKKTHEQKEAIFGAMITEVAKVRNPPRTFEQSAAVYGDTPLISNAEGGVTLLRAGDERELNQPLPQSFQLVPPVLTAIQEAAARGMMPREAFGIGQSQQSGSSIETLTESGRDKVMPWQTTLEMYHKECLDMDLRHIRNWGHLMGTDGDRGRLEFPMPTRQGDDYGELTPEMLRQTKYKTEVRLVSFRLQADMMKTQYVQMRKAMGLMEDVDALEMFGVQDAESYLRRIDIQEFKKTDEYRLAKMIEWMEQEGESPRTMALVQNLIMQRMMSGGGGPGGPPGMQGGRDAGALTGQPSVPGMAQAMGAPTGINGGAPPGPNGPQGGQLPGPPPNMGGLPPGVA